MAILARPVAPRALKAQREYELRMASQSVNPVIQAAIRIRQARRNASDAALDPLNQILVTRLVSCVHLANGILKLDSLVILVSHARKVISQTLKATPAAKAVIREHSKTQLGSLTAPPVSLGPIQTHLQEKNLAKSVK